MSLKSPLVVLSCTVLSCAALLLPGTMLAQDDAADDATEEASEEAAENAGEQADEQTGDLTDEIDDVVERRAAEEDTDGEPSDADVGEASYNTDDCRPMEDGDVEAEETDESDESDETADADADGEPGERDMDDCEPAVK